MEIFRAAAHAHLGEAREAMVIVEKLKLNYPAYPYLDWLESWLGRGAHLEQTVKLIADSGLDLRREYLPE